MHLKRVHRKLPAIILAYLCLGSVWLGAQSKDTLTSLEAFFKDTACNKMKFVGPLPAFDYNLRAADSLGGVPELLAFVVHFEITNEGAVINPEIDYHRSEDSLFIDSKHIIAVYRRLRWPQCGIPIQLADHRWRVVISVQANYSTRFRPLEPSETGTQKFFEAQIVRLSARQPSIIAPVVLGTYYYGS